MPRLIDTFALRSLLPKDSSYAFNLSVLESLQTWKRAGTGILARMNFVWVLIGLVERQLDCTRPGRGVSEYLQTELWLEPWEEREWCELTGRLSDLRRCTCHDTKEMKDSFIRMLRINQEDCSQEM
jgi:hypothetical protein